MSRRRTEIEFDARAQAVVDFASETELDLREHGCSHPIFGVLDGAQWLLFAGAHTERHRRQLIGYQLQPDFPVAYTRVRRCLNASADAFTLAR